MQMECPLILYELKSNTDTLVMAWKVPRLGQMADEVMPPWLVHQIQKGTIEITELGQLRGARAATHDLACNPGEYVLLTEDGAIEICPADEFTNKYEKLASVAAAA
jgi:hypothetical protein